MHITKGVMFALPGVVSGSIWRRYIPADGIIDARPSSPSASPASVQIALLSEQTPSSKAESLERRQAPANPVIPPAVAPAPMPPAPPVIPQAPPAVQLPAPAPAVPGPAVPPAPAPLAVITTLPNGDPTDFLTVQWIETTIGGTYSTWVPKTFTFHYNAQSPAPQPGKGYIGMGTLTGETGKTKTVESGAAATNGPEWISGVAVAFGAGIAGVLI